MLFRSGMTGCHSGDAVAACLLTMKLAARLVKSFAWMLIAMEQPLSWGRSRARRVGAAAPRRRSRPLHPMGTLHPRSPRACGLPSLGVSALWPGAAGLDCLVCQSPWRRPGPENTCDSHESSQRSELQVLLITWTPETGRRADSGGCSPQQLAAFCWCFAHGPSCFWPSNRSRGPEIGRAHV